MSVRETAAYPTVPAARQALALRQILDSQEVVTEKGEQLQRRMGQQRERLRADFKLGPATSGGP